MSVSPQGDRNGVTFGEKPEHRSVPLWSAMKTVPVMLRLDPADWKKFQAAAKDRDLMPAQLIRQVMREWLAKAGKK